MWETVNATSQISIKPFVLSDSAKHSTLSPEFVNLLNHAESQKQLNLSQSMNPLPETAMPSASPQQSFASNLLSNSSQFLNFNKSSSSITSDQIEPNNNLLGISTPGSSLNSLPPSVLTQNYDSNTLSSSDTSTLHSKFLNPNTSPSPNTPDQIEPNNNLLGTSTPNCGSNSLPSPILNQPSSIDRTSDCNINRESSDSSRDNFQQSFQDINQLLSSLKHSPTSETSSLVTSSPAPPYTPSIGSPTSPYTQPIEYHPAPHNRHTAGPQHLNYISIKPMTIPAKFHQELDRLLSKLPSTSPQIIHQNSYRNLNSRPTSAVSSDLYSCQSQPDTFPYTNTVSPQSPPGVDSTVVSSLLNQLLNSPAAVNQLKSILGSSDSNPQSDSAMIENNICSREAPSDKPSLDWDFIRYLSTLPHSSQPVQ